MQTEKVIARLKKKKQTEQSPSWGGALLKFCTQLGDEPSWLFITPLSEQMPGNYQMPVSQRQAKETKVLCVVEYYAMVKRGGHPGTDVGRTPQQIATQKRQGGSRHDMPPSVKMGKSLCI